ASTCCIETFLDDLLGDRWVGVELRHQTIVGDRANDALDFRGKKLFLRLVVKLWIGMLNCDDSDQAFEQVVAGDGRVFLFEKIILFVVLIDSQGEGRANSSLMRAAVRI